MAENITNSNKVLDKFSSAINIIANALLENFRDRTKLAADFYTRSSNTSRIASIDISSSSATTYSDERLGLDLPSNQSAQVPAESPDISASRPSDKSKNNSFCAVKSMKSMSIYADFDSSFDAIVRDRFSIKASTNSPVGIFNSLANRSSVSSSGICLWLNHTDQLGGSIFVRRFNSLYDSFKNSSLVNGLLSSACMRFTKFYRYVKVSINRLSSLPRITQTTKHPRDQVLAANQYSRKDGLFFKRLYEQYIRPKGRLASPSFTMPSYVCMGGIA